MSPTDQALLDRHRANLKNCQRFQCAACGIAKRPAEAHDVCLWRPESKMMARMAKGGSASYVICEECARKPESVTRPQIEASLAKRGLFG